MRFAFASLDFEMENVLAKVIASIAIGVFCWAMPAAASDEIRMIDTEAAKDCRFVSTETGTGFGMGASKQMANALKGIKKRAIKAKANSFVIKSASPAGSWLLVIADTYVCDATPKSITAPKVP